MSSRHRSKQRRETEVDYSMMGSADIPPDVAQELAHKGQFIMDTQGSSWNAFVRFATLFIFVLLLGISIATLVVVSQM